MGIMGVPESAVYGNASEVPDSESGKKGNRAKPELANETLEVSGAETEGLVTVAVATPGPLREEADRLRET